MWVRPVSRLGLRQVDARPHGRLCQDSRCGATTSGDWHPSARCDPVKRTGGLQEYSAVWKLQKRPRQPLLGNAGSVKLMALSSYDSAADAPNSASPELERQPVGLAAASNVVTRLHIVRQCDDFLASWTTHVGSRAGSLMMNSALPSCWMYSRLPPSHLRVLS